MSQPAASYTPLESLFLFQSLLAHGLDPGAFSRVSEALRGNALIRGDDAYDPARLTPDALQQLFLLVLREEIKAEAEAADGSDGPSSPAASRKRKLGSPPLPSLKDAYQHLDKVPALVDRLYARYREHAVKRIRDDERRFAAVQKEIQLLERSEHERLAKTVDSSLASTEAPQPSGLETIVAAGSKRGPTPNTPVYPPVPPTAAATPAAAVGASHLSTGSASTAAGTPMARPSPSPSPNSTAGSASVLQPPAGLSQNASRPLPPPVRLPKPAAGLYGDVVGKSDESSGSGTPQLLATPSPGALKWEKPYEPAQASTPQPSSLEATRQPMDRLSPQRQPQQPGQLTGPSSALASQTIAPIVGKSGLVAPQVTGPLAAALPARSRPAVVTPVIPPSRPSLPQTVAARQSPSSNAASESALGPQTQVSQQTQRTIPLASSSSSSPSTTTTTAPSTSLKDKPYLSPYGTQPLRPAIPEHIIRQAAGSPNMRRSGPATPKTPSQSAAAALARGFGTIWASLSTPSTPGPMVKEADSPAFEPVSPPRRASSMSTDTPKPGAKRSTSRPFVHGERDPPRPRGRPPRSARASVTPSFSGTRRSQSIVSLTDEPSFDHPDLSAKIKKEAMTPRLREDTGYTTADESLPGRLQAATPAGARLSKRKRQETPPAVPSAPPTGVLWTRGFTKVSSSALDQISSHRYANMFATGVRERDAPNYRQIVLQPLDITSIRAAIKQGNKAAAQAAANLPEGDPGVANVWLPVSEDLMPPRGIVNSAQLERQLVHMFCNAIMYNPDPDRGPGAGFMKRSKSEGEESVGYHLDENGVVKNTRSMFVEVEKLLGDLRSAENDRGVPAPSVTRQPSVATPAEETADDEDDLVGDGSSSMAGTAKRRRVSTRN